MVAMSPAHGGTPTTPRPGVLRLRRDRPRVLCLRRGWRLPSYYTYDVPANRRRRAGLRFSCPAPENLIYQANWLTLNIGNRSYGLSKYRIYDPELGIFLSRDFLNYPNKYRAFDNNPVLFTDAEGLATEIEFYDNGAVALIKDKNGKLCARAYIRRNPDGAMQFRVFTNDPDANCDCCAGNKFAWLSHENTRGEWRNDNAADFGGGLMGIGMGAASDPTKDVQTSEADRPKDAAGNPIQSSGDDRWTGNPWYAGPSSEAEFEEAKKNPAKWAGYAQNPQPKTGLYDNPGGGDFRTQLVCQNGGKVYLTWAWSANQPQNYGRQVPPPAAYGKVRDFRKKAPPMKPAAKTQTSKTP